jgi:endoglycosylceramidase
MGRYRQLLAAAWARGIYTVLDFHQDVYSECFCGDGFPCWTIANPMPPAHDCPLWSVLYTSPGVEQAFDQFWVASGALQAEYLAAWDTMIASFADEPGVVGFEPINEPSSGSANPSAFEATTLTDFFTRMIAHFTAKAPDTLVFVDDTGAAGTLVYTTMNRPVGNFVFAPHFYPIVNPLPEKVLPLMQTWSDLGAKWNVPVWVGEFGMVHSDDPRALAYMTAHFAALDTLGLGGAEWEYSVESTEWNSESASIVSGSGTELPVAQAVIRPFARAIAGSAVSQSYSPDAGSFTLTWTPAPGVSEVAVPVRAFPSGTAVTLSQGCYDATSVPGKILVDAEGFSAPVTLTVTSAH